MPKVTNVKEHNMDPLALPVLLLPSLPRTSCLGFSNVWRKIKVITRQQAHRQTHTRYLFNHYEVFRAKLVHSRTLFPDQSLIALIPSLRTCTHWIPCQALPTVEGYLPSVLIFMSWRFHRVLEMSLLLRRQDFYRLLAFCTNFRHSFHATT
jgi:hypothetical protein